MRRAFSASFMARRIHERGGPRSPRAKVGRGLSSRASAAHTGAMDTDAKIKDFLAAGPYAVVGASSAREKYGNKVLRAYLQNQLAVTPVHPREAQIEGLRPCPTWPLCPRGSAGSR
jgi:hypothetical protein